MKKFYGFFMLTLCALLGLSEANALTLYAQYDGTDDIYFYTWGGSSMEWPGKKGEKKTDGNGKVWFVQTLDGTGLVINNGGNGKQTLDIDISGLTEAAFVITDGGDKGFNHTSTTVPTGLGGGGETVVTPDAMYIMGNLTSWTAGSQIAMEKNGDVFTYEGQFPKGGDDGYSWFSFTSTSSDNWNVINANRYGPAANGTEAVIGTNPVGGRGDLSFKIVEGTYKLEYDFQAATLTVSTSTPLDPAFYLIGTFCEWDVNNKAQMTKEGDVYKITQAMNAGDKFKFINEKNEWIGGVSDGDFVVTKEQVKNGTPLSLAIGNAGQDFIIPVAGEWTFTIDPTAFTVVISGLWEDPDQQTYLIGTFCEWDEAKKVQMTKNGDIFTITQAMNAGDKFKFMDETGAWIGGVSDGDFVVTEDQVKDGTPLSLVVGNTGEDFLIPVAGEWTFTVDRTNMTVVISGDWVVPDKKFYLIGTFCEWNEANKAEMTKDGDVYKITQAMNAGDKFKLMNEAGEWIGGVSDGDFIVTKEQVTDGTPLSLVEGDAGEDFLIPVAGEWTLTFNPEAMTLVISGEWVQLIPVTGKVIEATPSSAPRLLAEVPIAGATVSLVNDENTYSTTTDADGIYVIMAAAGDYTMTVEAEGYSTYSAPVVVGVDMQPIDVALAVKTTGVDDIDAVKAVKLVKYVNLAGMQADQPFEGVNIKVTTYSDGTTQAVKVIK